MLGTIAGVPSCGPLTLGVNDEQDAATFASQTQAAERSGGKQLTAQPLPRDAAIGGETRKLETRNFVPRQTLRHGRWHGFMSYC